MAFNQSQNCPESSLGYPESILKIVVIILLQIIHSLSQKPWPSLQPNDGFNFVFIVEQNFIVDQNVSISHPKKINTKKRTPELTHGQKNSKKYRKMRSRKQSGNTGARTYDRSSPFSFDYSGDNALTPR